MCDRLGEMLGETIQLEKIGGGGLKMTTFNYKSIRFCSQNFPWINDPDTDEGVFRLSSNGKISVVLKAFYEAPAFSKEEVESFRQCLDEVVMGPCDALRAGWRAYKLKQESDF